QKEVIIKERKTNLSFKSKIKLIKKHLSDPSQTQTNLARWLFNEENKIISQGCISTILANKENLLKIDNSNLSKKPSWIDNIDINLPLSEKLIKFKAKQLHKNIPNERDYEFKASTGWFQKFKKRFGIYRFRYHGESGSITDEMVQQELPKINSITRQYKLDDIYNMDESSLYYRPFANFTYGTTRKSGIKHPKKRCTIFYCTNSSGTDKMPIGIINTAKNPKCFRNKDISNMDFHYYQSKKGYMTRKIFKVWLKYFDRRATGRKVLLVLDNYSAHILNNVELNNLRLQNTRILYLPPNFTSRLQHLDAGVIAAFKKRYSEEYFKLLLFRLDNNIENPCSINLYDCIQISIKVWNIISSNTILNCFYHTKIESYNTIGPVTQTVQVYINMDNYYQSRLNISPINRQLTLQYII
ncbi:DDE-domain-containing protein, partial [Conidiobolus coronatus NRRL 28638]